MRGTWPAVSRTTFNVYRIRIYDQIRSCMSTYNIYCAWAPAFIVIIAYDLWSHMLYNLHNTTDARRIETLPADQTKTHTHWHTTSASMFALRNIFTNTKNPKRTFTLLHQRSRRDHSRLFNKLLWLWHTYTWCKQSPHQISRGLGGNCEWVRRRHSILNHIRIPFSGSDRVQRNVTLRDIMSPSWAFFRMCDAYARQITYEMDFGYYDDIWLMGADGKCRAAC